MPMHSLTATLIQYIVRKLGEVRFSNPEELVAHLCTYVPEMDKSWPTDLRLSRWRSKMDRCIALLMGALTAATILLHVVEIR